MEHAMPLNNELTEEQLKNQHLLKKCQLYKLRAADFQAERHLAAGRKYDKWVLWANSLLIPCNALLSVLLIGKLLLAQQFSYPMVIVQVLLAVTSTTILAFLAKFNPESELRGHKQAAAKFSELGERAIFIGDQYLAGAHTLKKSWQLLEKISGEYYALRRETDSINVGGKISSKFYDKVKNTESGLEKNLEEIRQALNDIHLQENS